jgi:hypothetical protein
VNSSNTPAGRLYAGQWTKVYFAWGAFIARYLLFTTAPSVDVRWYGVVTIGVPVPRGPLHNGEEFSVPVVGYSDVWFNAPTDAEYRMIPQDYEPLPQAGGRF